jgi:hypothetical protein
VLVIALPALLLHV